MLFPEGGKSWGASYHGVIRAANKPNQSPEPRCTRNDFIKSNTHRVCASGSAWALGIDASGLFGLVGFRAGEPVIAGFRAAFVPAFGAHYHHAATEPEPHLVA